MRLGFLACYNSDNYVTNASKDKELSNDVDGSREPEPEERWLLGSPAAGNPPFVICLRDPSPRHPANGVDSTLVLFPKKEKKKKKRRLASTWDTLVPISIPIIGIYSRSKYKKNKQARAFCANFPQNYNFVSQFGKFLINYPRVMEVG